MPNLNVNSRNISSLALSCLNGLTQSVPGAGRADRVRGVADRFSGTTMIITGTGISSAAFDCTGNVIAVSDEIAPPKAREPRPCARRLAAVRTPEDEAARWAGSIDAMAAPLMLVCFTSRR
jgi:hypothetical protein